jgi:cyclopropane-fatty-acyl-phospholipid synthase
MGAGGELTQAADTAHDSSPVSARVHAADRWLAARVQRMIEPAAVRLELWDGSSAYAGSREPIGGLLVGDRRTLLGLAFNPDLWFGESYMTGQLEVRGPLEPVVEALTANSSLQPSWIQRVRMAFASSNSMRDARHNVHHHYDLGNPFYQLWLDRELVYTCAYFEEPEMSLEEAQVAKLDLVCRKLRLHRGETVVEAGCGWGALAIHMARHYGVNVKAFNVSREQLTYARERAAREGLSDRVEFIDDDYRNVSGEFDAFVSVGMLEHVGLQHYHSLAEVLHRCLKRDHGRGLLHFIGRDIPRPLNAWITRRIFPGAYPPTLAEVTKGILAPGGMSVIDVENLRLHYRETLAHWSKRFASAKDQVRATYGEAFRRAWELYLAGSQAAFATGWMQLFQVVFVPRETPPPSWTRADVYVHPIGFDGSRPAADNHG